MPTNSLLLRGVGLTGELAKSVAFSVQDPDRPPGGGPLCQLGPQSDWNSGTYPVQSSEIMNLNDEQLMRKLAMLTEMARPLLAKLPTVIDVTPGT